MNQAQLWSQICDVSQLTGQFTLRSGKVSDTYFDKYQFETRPDLLREVARQMRVLVPKDAEVLGGLELGGVPLAVAIALESGHPCVFVRKAAKTYGTCRLAEGPSVSGKRVCLIEDVISTGGQVAESARELRKLGAQVEHVVCAIWRGASDTNPLTEHGISMRAVFSSGKGV